jgi:hypothetical protein
VEVRALKQRGWSISATARHLNRDAKTARAYLNCTRVPRGPHSLGARPARAIHALPHGTLLRASLRLGQRPLRQRRLGYVLRYPSLSLARYASLVCVRTAMRATECEVATPLVDGTSNRVWYWAPNADH